MLSAGAFNLGKPKILSSGKGLIEILLFRLFEMAGVFVNIFPE